MGKIIVNKGDNFILRGDFGEVNIKGYGAINQIENRMFKAIDKKFGDYLSRLKSDGIIEFADSDTKETIDEDAKADNIKDALEAQEKRSEENRKELNISSDNSSTDIPSINSDVLNISNEESTEAENDGSVASADNDTDTRSQDATTDASEVTAGETTE